MRILSRYVLKEFIVPLIYCLIGFISIYILFELFGSFGRLIESDLSFFEIARFFAGYLAPFFMYLVPAALLLATLYTMWMFCRHSEIVAMRASGISFLAIVKPVLSAAFAMGLVVLYVNEVYVPKEAQRAKQMKSERFDREKLARASDIVYRNSKDYRTWTADGSSDLRRNILKDVKVSFENESGVRTRLIVAPQAEYLDGEWWFCEPAVTHYDSSGTQIASTTPELDALKLRVFPELRERPGDIQMQNQDWQYSSIRQKLRTLRQNRDFSPEAKNDARYDIYSQIAAPFACLVITLFAIPAGIASGRQSVFKGILGALGMYFSFYALVIGGMVLSKQGLLPPLIAAFAPHVIFLAMGIRLFVKQR